jgi:hypothetical protein
MKKLIIGTMLCLLPLIGYGQVHVDTTINEDKWLIQTTQKLQKLDQDLLKTLKEHKKDWLEAVQDTMYCEEPDFPYDNFIKWLERREK